MLKKFTSWASSVSAKRSSEGGENHRGEVMVTRSGGRLLLYLNITESGRAKFEMERVDVKELLDEIRSVMNIK